MGYANPVEAMGVDRLRRGGAEAGVDGVLVVDYPPEERRVSAAMKQRGLDPIFLLAPTSTEARIAGRRSGRQRLYLLRVAEGGVTGGGTRCRRRGRVRPRSARNRPAGRRRFRHPRRRETAARIAAVADAVVIGSRIIEEIEKSTGGNGVRAWNAGRRSIRAAHGRWTGKDELAQQTAAAQDRAANRASPANRRCRGPVVKCPSCEAVLYATDLETTTSNVCPKCGHPPPARPRAPRPAARSRRPVRDRRRGRAGRLAEVQGQPRYPDRSGRCREDTGEADALVVMQGAIKTVPVVARRLRVRLHGRLDGLGGRRALRARRKAAVEELPFICVTASGGARMQEGLFSR